MSGWDDDTTSAPDASNGPVRLASLLPLFVIVALVVGGCGLVAAQTGDGADLAAGARPWLGGSVTVDTIGSVEADPSDLGWLDADERVVYANDFSSGELGPEWRRYDSVGNQGWGLRRPSAFSVVDAPGAAGGRCLAIDATMGVGDEAGQVVTGGAKLIGHSLTYGRYTVRVRVDDDPAEVTSGVVILWPSSNEWPAGGEINIVENYANRDTRTPVESRLHWLRPGAEPPFDRRDDTFSQVDHMIDGSEWHTYVLDWRPDSVTVSVDGGPPRSLAINGAVVPSWDMDLTVQLDAFDHPGTGRQPVLERDVRMCIDFVEIVRYQP